MDALFGLPRKKAAGISFRDPIHGHLFFGKQERVDEFVAMAHTKDKRDTKVCGYFSLKQHILTFDNGIHQICSDFLAGNALRSSHRYHALDETAILGSACRHECPLIFINLKHGERYM